MFDLLPNIFIGGRCIVIDYLCATFGNFSHFGFIMRRESQNNRQTDSITEVDDCYTHVTAISMNNKLLVCIHVTL